MVAIGVDLEQVRYGSDKADDLDYSPGTLSLVAAAPGPVTTIWLSNEVFPIYLTNNLITNARHGALIAKLCRVMLAMA